MTTGEPREVSRRKGRERDSHGRRHHSSSRSRRDEPSPRRRRDDRRHESDRSQNRRRTEENDKAGDRDEKSNRPLQDAQALSDDPSRAEGKPLTDTKDVRPVRHERSPRGTKRFSEHREAWRPRSFFQHDERDSAGQGGRRYDRQASDYGRQRDQKEHLGDRDKHKPEGHDLHEKVEQARQQNDGDSTWKHDGYFQLEEEAPVAKRRPALKEMGMPLGEHESSLVVTEPDPRSRKPDQPGPASAFGEERRNYYSREYIRPDDGARRGFSDHRIADQRDGYDSRGRFAGRGGRGRDRFNNSYGGRNNMHEYNGRNSMHAYGRNNMHDAAAAGDQADKWKHDLYDQTNSSSTPLTEEEQIAKVEALLAL